MNYIKNLLVALLLFPVITPAQVTHSVSISAVPSTSLVTGYNVYRAVTPGGPYTAVGSSLTPVLLDKTVTSGTTYYYVMTATVTGAESVYSNEAVAVVPPDVPPPPPGPLSSLWQTTIVPSNVVGNDSSSLELGTRFSSSVAGQVVGVRFYKATNTPPGTIHTGTLWGPTGVKLASGTFFNETASGWQTLTFAAPVTITVGTMYTVSYHTSQYAYSNSYFTSGLNTPPLSTPKDAGVYRYGATSAYPQGTWMSSNYWADVLFLSSTVVQPPPVPSATFPCVGLVCTLKPVNIPSGTPFNGTLILGNGLMLSFQGILP